MSTFEKTIGLEIVIKVNGFQDAKRWMYRILDARIAKCSSCGEPATHIWWNDAAEWYFECPAHYTYKSQWTGSTHWNPAIFSKAVLPGAARAWLVTLNDEDRKVVRLREYDATDYWSMLDDWQYVEPTQVVTLEETGRFRHFVRLFELSSGGWLYERRREWGAPGDMVLSSHAYGLTGWFATSAEAVEAAKIEAFT